MKLYDIPMEMAVLEAELVDAEGELSPDLEQRLDAFLKGGKDKIEAAAMIVRTLEAQAKVCAEESHRLAERSTAHENNAKRLKGLMIGAVDALGGKVKTSLFTIWTQDSAATKAVEVQAGTDLADLIQYFPAFVRTKYEIDKEAVRIAHENGADLPSVISVQINPGIHYLRIR
jgi:phage host-nuclease inhibitor protein Gam